MLEVYKDISNRRWLTSIGRQVGVSRETVRRLLQGKYSNDLVLVKILEEYKQRICKIDNVILNINHE